MQLPTTRQLQYLKLLDEHRSFSRAAEAAHVTQPTLSAGIAELERILGAALVDRARSGVILTAAGEDAVRRAKAILAQAEDLVQAARGAGRQPQLGLASQAAGRQLRPECAGHGPRSGCGHAPEPAPARLLTERLVRHGHALLRRRILFEGIGRAS